MLRERLFIHKGSKRSGFQFKNRSFMFLDCALNKAGVDFLGTRRRISVTSRSVLK